MRQFLHLFFLISLCWGCISCKTFQLQDATSIPPNSQSTKNLYFSSPEAEYLYRGNIEVYGNAMSGLLIIKKIKQGTHRVVMTTDFGNKLLDFEISEKEFIPHYMAPDLDKSIIKKVLEKDFRILLREKYLPHLFFENQKDIISKSSVGSTDYYLYFDKKNILLNKIIFVEDSREKINFSFVPKTPILADEIEIIHLDIKLKIHLKYLENN